MAKTIDNTSELLRAAIRELDEERDRLATALSQLEGSRASGSARGRNSTGGRRARGARRERRARKIAPAGERQRQLLDYLKAHDGARPTEIARALGVTPNNVQNVLRKARREKLVKKDGTGYRLASRGG